MPTLELDDGACISETIAICRYFEELQPEPALMGETPREKADIEMWQRRVEQTLNDTVATYFHHGTPGLGSLESYQNKEWGEQNLKRYHDAMQRLDDHLEGRTFMCGETFSIADITLFSGLYLGGILEIEIPDRLTNLNRWRKVVSSRPSASA